ncbi:MAG: DUF167 domain-containing protein [Nitrospinota bacterium]
MTGPRGGGRRSSPGRGAILRVRLKSRAGRDGVEGLRDGVWWLRVSAPPVGGAANRACLRFLAELLGVAPSALELRSGARSPLKRIEVRGLGEEEVASALARAAEGENS